MTPYYVVVIPESIVLNDEDPMPASITASELKNMQDGDTLDVTISGLDADGNATITRDGATNTLDVPVKDADGKPLANGDIAAQFAKNSTVPTQGGTITFGAPVGDRKAGDYTGTVTFTIAYKKAGN